MKTICTFTIFVFLFTASNAQELDRVSHTIENILEYTESTLRPLEEPLNGIQLQKAGMHIPTFGEDNCYEYCSPSYTNLCGYNGYEFKHFTDYCDFKRTNCYAKNLFKREYVQVNTNYCYTTTQRPIAEKRQISYPESFVISGNCPKYCYVEGPTICALQGNYYRYFENECFMTAENCIQRYERHPEYQKVAYQYCTVRNLYKK